MAIKYSLSASNIQPGKPESGKKIYARAQYNEIIDLPALARHIQEHGSPFTRDVIQGVLSAAVDCMREQLVAGNKVDFGDLGSFFVTLHGEGVAKAEDFNPYIHIKRVEAKWTPSVYFDNLKDDPALKWDYTLTRTEMAEAKKQAKQEATDSVGGNKPGTPGGGGSGDDGELGE